MADWSIALRNFMDNFGSTKRALTGGKFNLYQGTMPTAPDDPIVGTLLVSCTTSSGTLTPAVAPRWAVNCTVDGTWRPTINSILIVPNVDVAATGVIATTIDNVVAAINAYGEGYISYKAWRSGTDTLIVEGPPSMGTAGNSWVIADGGTCTTTVSTPTGATLGARAGVAHVNGCIFGAVSNGVLSTVGVWSGVAVATGTANFFVYFANPTDDDGTIDVTPYHKRRIVGSCGTTSGADYVMSSQSITITKTHSLDTSSITFAQRG